MLLHYGIINIVSLTQIIVINFKLIIQYFILWANFLYFKQIKQ